MTFLDRARLRAESIAKRIAYRAPGLRRLAVPSYTLGLEPAQLAWLVDSLEQTKDLGGAVVEVGVARGMTTVFLNEALSNMSDPRSYICIDTFSGFTQRDVNYERVHRGMQLLNFREFSYNDPRIFAKNMSRLGYRRIRCIASDIASVAPDDVGPVSVAIIDVDLYLPTQAALALTWQCLQPGGKALVDDLKPGTKWDGAYQALGEFADARGITWSSVGTKGGVFQKPAQAT
jgi:O-methyltransferase